MGSDTATSPQLLRRMNVAAVLRLALAGADFTAAEVMRETGLTRATVLDVCADLESSGWLTGVTPDRTAARVGRPAIRYRLRDDAGVVVGVDAGEVHYRVVVADLRGRVLGRVHAMVDAHEVGREGRVRAAEELIGAALSEAHRTADDVLVTIVGIPAPVDAQGASPVGDGAFWPLMNAGFARLGGRVVVENDANLAALAEHEVGADTHNSATLLSGERFGAGLIVDGRLLRGARGGAGEARFMQALFPGAQWGHGVGRLARAWARERLASSDEPSALRELDVEDVEAEDVFHAASEGDALAKKIIERLGERLARVVVVMSSLLDVDRVVLAGAIASSLGPVVTQARVVLQEQFQSPYPQLVASELGGDVVVRGAIESALAHIRARPLDFTPGPGG
ncbi:MAG: ROK family protein [Microbacterium sp.]